MNISSFDVFMNHMWRTYKNMIFHFFKNILKNNYSKDFVKSVETMKYLKIEGFCKIFGNYETMKINDF